VANETKGTQSEARLDKAAREDTRSKVPDYEVAAQAVREKMARLKALRLARDAAMPKAAATTKSTSKGPRSASGRAAPKGGKSASKSSVPLSEWLDGQKDSGRRS
jgi:hypothetical protein